MQDQPAQVNPKPTTAEHRSKAQGKPGQKTSKRSRRRSQGGKSPIVTVAFCVEPFPGTPEKLICGFAIDHEERQYHAYEVFHLSEGVEGLIDWLNSLGLKG